MNKYMSFDELKEELGKDYDKKLYEIGLSALKEIERLNNKIEKAVEYIKENAKYKKISINNRKYYSEYLINQVLDILNGRSDE